MRVDIRCGRPLTYPRVETPSKHLANEVTARIWPCVELQWAWLGGPIPVGEDRGLLEQPQWRAA